MTQDIKRYGRTEEEKRVEKTIQCRQIVSEILNFGVDEFQKAKIIQLLSMEMEDRDFMLTISESYKNFEESTEEKNNKSKLLTI
tara:strand:+ start:148 stop:399 length:252 start_codon:yes stop_codon:yes gene_type:complete